MPHYKLALLGFGNVGQALARLLLRKQDELHHRYELTFSVTGIATGHHGNAIDPAGINLAIHSISFAAVGPTCCSRIHL
ncbi:MAG: hypothetical protein MUE67_13110 [Anaerolineales bacterium]|nr:hypothetical protein [Anaerolineales bacterium]